ncbi:MAG: excisionase family DNA-binding protein [Actinomycetota bacterium]|nr:excisionase family DNA-binding protein [Actinomycetota bacterium]
MTPSTVQLKDAAVLTDGASGDARSLLTVEAAAQRLSIGRTTMYALLKDGQINSVRIGRLRRVPAEALTAYISRLAADQDAPERTNAHHAA